MKEAPKIAKQGPYVIEMEPGTYFWCSCGQSASQPFCDGSHMGTGFTPKKFVVTEARKVAWCGCKYTKAECLCDGSHGKINLDQG